jgi:vacuolar-type H+-ATPase subunit E/Vma4
MTDERLRRVEQKIDSLQEAVISLARVEERITTIFSRQTKIEERVNSMDEKLSRIHPMIAFGERLFWITVVAYFSVGDKL